MKKIIIFILSIFITYCNSNNYENQRKLIGIWQGYLKDSETNVKIDEVTLEFTSDGSFIQKIGKGKSQNIIQQSFRLEKNKIYSKEINSETEDQAKYYFENEKLIIEFEGVKNDYEKVQ